MKIDSHEIKQYEGERVVSEIELLDDEVNLDKKFVLAYVETLQANCLVPVKDITGKCDYCGYEGHIKELEDCCDEAEAGGFNDK
jgi:hypothetical protein